MVKLSRAKVIIQIDHSTILDTLNQSSSLSMTSIIRMNVFIVSASQFL